MGVVPVGRLVFHVRHGDGDAALALFRRALSIELKARNVTLELCLLNTLAIAAVVVVLP